MNTERITLAEASPAARLAESWEAGPTPPDLEDFVEGHPGLDDRDLADLVLVDQTFRWKSGPGIPAEDYFKAWPSLVRDPEVRLDVVYGEYRARRQRGEDTDLEEFCRRFSDLADELRRQVEAADCLQFLGEAPGSGTDDRDASGSETDPRAPLSLADFELGERLGSGAMGEVYRAEQKSLARPVAVKFLKVRGDDEKQFVERFLREAQTTARMRHPGIVDVRGIGQAPDRRYFLVMDLVEGSSLDEKTRSGPLPIDEAVGIVATVAEAVEHAHACGVVHRDLKPANILIDRQGRVLVTDFGLAKCFSSNTPALSMPGLMIGTPQHMAPEQVDRQYGSVGPRTDVYGLGSLFYTLLTGRPPYSGDTALELILKVTSDEPIPPPAEIRPGIPPAIESACLKCLSRLPEDRYASAAEVREALLSGAGDTVTGDSPTVVMPGPPKSPTGRRRVRIGAIAGAGVLAVVACCFVIALGFGVGDAPGRGSVPPPVSGTPIRVDWDVEVFPEGQFDRKTSLSGLNGGVTNGDMLRLRLDFSRETYAYVFWIGSEGEVQCLYPAHIGPEMPTASVRIPDRTGDGLPVHGPAGTELCVVLLREARLQDPVASFSQWKPDPAALAPIDVALLDGLPLAPSRTGPALAAADEHLMAALAKLPGDTGSRALGGPQPLDGPAGAEALRAWCDAVPDDLGSLHWLAIPHRDADVSAASSGT